MKEIYYHNNPSTFIDYVKTKFIKTDVVLDIGSGIYPFNHINFVPKLQIIIEPYSEYVDVLKEVFIKDSYVLIFKAEALDVLSLLTENSIDSVFAIDVIEHMDKNSGIELITELERVTRSQIIIFTPLGFMPQHVSSDKKDRWGLNGGEFQEHLSGWTPEDFGNKFDFYVCKEFHKFGDDGKELDEVYGAFFAIQNMGNNHTLSNVDGGYFKPTPKDQLITELQSTIYKMSTSYSWKITSPLRYFKKFIFKKIRSFRDIQKNYYSSN